MYTVIVAPLTRTFLFYKYAYVVDKLKTVP